MLSLTYKKRKKIQNYDCYDEDENDKAQTNKQQQKNAHNIFCVLYHADKYNKHIQKEKQNPATANIIHKQVYYL